MLIVSGALVGASGTLLTMMMGARDEPLDRRTSSSARSGRCRRAPGAAAIEGTVRSATAEDVAIMLAYAQRVVIVPGYGMAVAQAQHAVRELADELEKKGVEVDVRDPSRRRPDAGPHERAARRGERALHGAEGDGRDQPASSRRPTSRS